MSIYFLVASIAITCGVVRHFWKTQQSPGAFGPANTITLCRNFLVAVIINILLFNYGPHESMLIASLSISILIMDGLDGYVARKLNICSDFGARFDMESDAFFILVLCIATISVYGAPYWIILIGAMRYLYVLGQYFYQPLNLPVRDRYSRKVFCVIQIVALVLPFTEVLQKGIWELLLLVSLMLLAFSFARDIVDQIKDSRETTA